MMARGEALTSGFIFFIWLLTVAFVFVNLDWESRVYSLTIFTFSFVLNTALKAHFRTERVIDDKSRIYYPGIQKYSFPSAHTQLAFTASSIIESFYPPLWLYSITLAFATAASRYLLGRHTRKEILWGAVLGYVVGQLGVIIYGRI